MRQACVEEKKFTATLGLGKESTDFLPKLLTKSPERKDNQSHQNRQASGTRRLPDMTQLLYRTMCSTCSYLRKTCACSIKIQHQCSAIGY